MSGTPALVRSGYAPIALLIVALVLAWVEVAR